MNLTSKLLFSLLTIPFLSTFGYVVRRECPLESRNIDQECPKSANYVCAYFTSDNCDSEICQKLAVNECFACKDPSVQYYISGLCDSEKIYCEETTRDVFPDTCDDIGSNEVCAYTTQGCLEGECAVSSAYECNVCSDSRIDYYRLGKCKSEELLLPCDGGSDFCSSQPAQPPVCIFKDNCEGDDCTETFANNCDGCNQYPNGRYKSAPCEKDRTACNPDSSEENCATATSGPVCAYFKLFDFDEGNSLYQTTVDSSCIACQDTVVGYYTQGQCSTTPATTQTYCLPSHNLAECADVYEPVCGFKQSVRFDASKDTFSNGCSACQDKDVVYYEPGTCSYQCPDYFDLNVDVVNCNGSLVEPICVYSQIYDDFADNSGNEDLAITFSEEEAQFEVESAGSSGSSEENQLLNEGNIVVIDNIRYRTRSIKNSCVACFDLSSSLGVSFYKKGLCPGDEGIRCENEATSYYYGTISPVCGIFSEGCSDSSCRTTFTEPLAACGFSSAISYTPGYCPGDQGISCDLYRSQFDTVCEGRDTYTIPVCGYTSANCQDESCRTTYNNQCYACADSSVLFFQNGAC